MEKIPHIIHYCWFGRNPKSELVLNCIESWKKYLPGYEIREWNEDNYDVTQVNFVKEAYENQKWAFVSDYVRFDVLYQFGGIYFDTDVEVMGRRGFLTNGEYQEIDGIAVYPTEYFCAVDLDVHEKVITDKTIAVHHYAGSWLQPSLKRKVQNVLKKTIGVENYRKLLHLKRKIVKKADGESK